MIIEGYHQPRRGDSNEYPQHMFLWKNKQNYPLLITKYSPYLFHWSHQSDFVYNEQHVIMGIYELENLLLQSNQPCSIITLHQVVFLAFSTGVSASLTKARKCLLQWGGVSLTNLLHDVKMSFYDISF